jgi:hypothetical protein
MKHDFYYTSVINYFKSYLLPINIRLALIIWGLW